jgi:hypothetical protein
MRRLFLYGLRIIFMFFSSFCPERFLVNSAGCMMAAGFVRTVHHLKLESGWSGNVFAGDGLHIVAGTAEAGNIDFDNIGFHEKPPVIW